LKLNQRLIVTTILTELPGCLHIINLFRLHSYAYALPVSSFLRVTGMIFFLDIGKVEIHIYLASLPY
jgi:hypothetical protein